MNFKHKNQDKIMRSPCDLPSISILGCGWLGMSLAERFVQMGYAVKGSSTSVAKLDKIASVGASPYLINIKYLTAEGFGEPNEIADITRFIKSEILIINMPSQDLESFRKLLAFVEMSEIKKVIFVSSTSVYPNASQVFTEESTLVAGSSPLLQIEQLLKESRSIKTTVIRFGGLIGYNRQPGRFFPAGSIISDPEARVNMIHRDDCIGIIEQIILQDVWGEVFNCCADSHPTKREFYTKAALDIGLEPPKFQETLIRSSAPGAAMNDDPPKSSSDHPVGKIISNEKVKKRLNFEFKYPDLMNFYLGT